MHCLIYYLFRIKTEVVTMLNKKNIQILLITAFILILCSMIFTESVLLPKIAVAGVIIYSIAAILYFYTHRVETIILLNIGNIFVLLSLGFDRNILLFKTTGVILMITGIVGVFYSYQNEKKILSCLPYFFETCVGGYLLYYLSCVIK